MYMYMYLPLLVLPSDIFLEFLVMGEWSAPLLPL